MADEQNEKTRRGSLPEPVVEPAWAEECRRVAEIARELEELRPVLESRDRLERFGAAETAKGPPAQPGPSAGPLMLRWIEIARDACRRAAAEIHRLAGVPQEAVEEKTLADETAAKTAEGKFAAVAAARREEARQAAKEKARPQATGKAAEAHARPAAREAADRQAAEDARLKAEQAARKAADAKPKKQADMAGADLAQERARNQKLGQQLAAHMDDRKLLAQERARIHELEQQLAAHVDDQKLLAQERARIHELEQQLAAHAEDQKLLAQQRARGQALVQELAIRQNEAQKLLVEQTTRIDELEQQLAAHADDQKLLAEERARSQELEQQLAAAEATLDLVRTAKVDASDRPTSIRTALEAPGDRETARLMTQARVLLGQGNIIAARRVLERAAESGSALALFLLAETYDRAILSAWGIFGRRGDVSKARDFYTKAAAAGVHEAKHRLTALR